MEFLDVGKFTQDISPGKPTHEAIGKVYDKSTRNAIFQTSKKFQGEEKHKFKKFTGDVFQVISIIHYSIYLYACMHAYNSYTNLIILSLYG